MLIAVVRILFIGFLSVFGIGAALFGLRTLTQNQSYPDFPHPMKNQKIWQILWVPTAGPADGSSFIAGAQLQQLADESLVLWPTHYIKVNNKVRFLGQISPEEWKKLQPESLSFDEFLNKYSNQAIFVEVNHPKILDIGAFYEQIKNSRNDNRVLIQTSSQSLKTSLKRMAPTWLFGATTAEQGKFRLLSSIFLESLVETTYDFITLKNFTQMQLDELKKRHIHPLKFQDQSIVTAQLAL